MNEKQRRYIELSTMLDIINSMYDLPLYSFASQPRAETLPTHMELYYKERNDKVKLFLEKEGIR